MGIKPEAMKVHALQVPKPAPVVTEQEDEFEAQPESKPVKVPT